MRERLWSDFFISFFPFNWCFLFAFPPDRSSHRQMPPKRLSLLASDLKVWKASKFNPISKSIISSQFSLFISFQGTTTIWPQKYQSTHDSVKFNQKPSRSRTSDDENVTRKSAHRRQHHSLSHQSNACRANDAIHSTPTERINRQSTDGSSTEMKKNQRPTDAAWQTSANASDRKASSDTFHTTFRHAKRSKWMKSATEMTTNQLKLALITCIASSTPKALNMITLHVNKPTSTTCRRVKNESHNDVTLSTAERSSIGRLQAVSENCCQFLYSLICFHFCMQVSQTQSHFLLLHV